MSFQGLLEANFVSKLPSEEIFKKIRVWLKFERVTILEERSPYHIRANWKGNIARMHAAGTSGLGYGGPFLPSAFTAPFVVDDPYEKDITVNIRDHGSQSVVNISIRQTNPRHSDKGFVYWGMRLENLCESLEIQPNKINLPELYPSSIVRHEIRKIFRDYFLLMLIPTVFILLIFRFELDKILAYSLLFVLPLTIFYGSKYQIYKNIQNRTNHSI